MSKNLLLLPFLLLSVFLKAQCYYPPCPTCVDSTAINIYYYCSGDYEPVCGCNGVTYRNVCAAEYWGGLLTSQNFKQNAICGDFDIDFVPDEIVPGSRDVNYNPYGTLSIYSNFVSAYALIQIYDVYGRVWYVNQQAIGISPPAFTIQIAADNLPAGVYYLFVTMNGEFLKKKFIKADRD